MLWQERLLIILMECFTVSLLDKVLKMNSKFQTINLNDPMEDFREK